MKTVILAGGQGTRLGEETALRPKPMVEIGGRPILWHIMNIYAAHGYCEFLVALGYKSEIVKRYFLDYHYMQRSMSINLANGHVDVHDGEREDWLVHLIDTGLETQTGGRLARLAHWIGDETFLMTYGDGHGRAVTVTAVRPPSRFGGLAMDGDLVTHFVEKPQLGEGWINGGFFVLNRDVFDYLGDDDTVFEHEPMERLAKAGQLVAYRHEGFWQCMDTLRDARLLNNLWESGNAPWTAFAGRSVESQRA
jgi:glucose-1-phosphate cytidylyltransferase